MTFASLGRRSLIATGVALLLSAVPGAALGHVELLSSIPAPGENLEAPPTEITLTFDGELDPAASGFTVVDRHGEEVGNGEVDLDVADRNVMTGSVDVAEPGVYTVEWAVLGADGHEVRDSFSFGYATDEEIPEASGDGHHDSPDTAVAGGTVEPLVLAGLALLALAGLAAGRRIVVG